MSSWAAEKRVSKILPVVGQVKTSVPKRPPDLFAYNLITQALTCQSLVTEITNQIC